MTSGNVEYNIILRIVPKLFLAYIENLSSIYLASQKNFQVVSNKMRE